jgi:cold shock protein
MADGTVKWFNPVKRFGLIVPDDLSHYVFVHFSSIEGTGHRDLRKGQRVDFDSKSGAKGPRATRVRPLRRERGDRPTADVYVGRERL